MTTLTTTSVFNTTVSSQHPGASTHSLSTSYTTKRTTVVVTLTKTVPLSTGTAYSSTIRGTGVSSGVPSVSSPTSIRLSTTLSYPTTTALSLSNTSLTSLGSSTPSTAYKEPCTTHEQSTFTSVSSYHSPPSTSSPGFTVSSALPTLVTPTGTATLSSVSGGYDYPPSTKESAVSPGTTVGSAKPTLVSSSTSDIPGGYDTQYPAPTSSLGITVSSALPTLISPTASSIPGGYDYPPSPSSKASEETTSTEYLGTTVASARPSLVSPSVSEVSPTPTTFETRKSDEYTSASTIYGGYEFGRRRALRM